MKWISILAAVVFAFPVLGAEFPAFKVQEIDKTVKVGYGLRIVDLNADGKLDVVVADSARVIWFDQSRDWKLRTIIDNAKAGVKPDNVCLDVADIDGDGKLDVALGADWQPNNTKTGGSLQWIRQGETIDQWTVHPIAKSIPTLHRIRFADVIRGGRPELLVAPLKGGGPTAAATLYAFSVPDSPTDAWPEPRVLVDSLHMMHNIRIDPSGRIITASAEGVGRVYMSDDGPKWKSEVGRERDDHGPGSSEVDVSSGETHFIAAIEPFHGHQVVTYTYSARRARWPLVRTVIDEQLKAGHALWCADLNADGVDEIIAGFREPTDADVGPGINLYRVSARGGVVGETLTWEKRVLDDKGIACEDLACADLDADGDVDIVACGRATQNVRIYWNQRVNPG